MCLIYVGLGTKYSVKKQEQRDRKEENKKRAREE